MSQRQKTVAAIEGTRYFEKMTKGAINDLYRIRSAEGMDNARIDEMIAQLRSMREEVSGMQQTLMQNLHEHETDDD